MVRQLLRPSILQLLRPSTLKLLRRSILWIGVLCAALPASPAFGQRGAQNGEWSSYGGDTGSTKYSPLDAIDGTNVQNLHVVWRWQSVDYDRKAENPDLVFSDALLATPLKVGNALYTSTNLGQAAAIDPVTGETIWVYNSLAEGTGAERRSTRGLAYWTDGSEDRLLLVSGEHLVALDPETGALSGEFGEDGKVDLRRNMGPELEEYRWNAAPLVCGDVVIVGAAISDSPTRQEATPGYVRAYHVVTGQLQWRFNPVPQPGDLGHETWEDGSWEYTGGANVWSLMSADEELGYVYLPVSTPTNDWYGGHRRVPVSGSRQSVARMKELGMEHRYVEITGGDHVQFISRSEEVIGMLFDFFNTVAKKP